MTANTARNEERPLAALACGGKAALARALAQIERMPHAASTLALLDAAWLAPRAQVVGITGPPGVGKSTLTGAVMAALRRVGRSVAVIAVDPSSRATGGALLGDRLRLNSNPEDAGSFVRSMAARDRLGGLAPETFAAAILLRALFDLVLIETVGVGQSETDVADAADTVVFCVQPASGDSVQFMKAGIVEIPQIAVVTKADLGRAAERALADLKGALGLAQQRSSWSVRTLALAATQAGAAEQLLVLIDEHLTFLKAGGRLKRQRERQAQAWLEASLREDFGRRGLARAEPWLAASEGEAPFGRLARIRAHLEKEDSQ